MMKRYLLILMLALPTFSRGAIPTGYYSGCEGLKGKQLIEALEDAISRHDQVGYNGLWSLYSKSDIYDDGKIWDIYSTKHWTYQREQCGTYSDVGDCYNREHSFPKSWFDDAYPMYCDAHHIYPTDGKVNGQRSNYPYGECANGTTLPSSGGVKALGKLGTCTFAGYSGIVFEPDDQYKGDLARTYFYMAACYNSLIDDWHSDMLASNSFPAFKPWAINLLLKWHRQDPVSDKERKRNEAIFEAQHNRNPFIDYPELAEHIWGNKSDSPWISNTEAEPRLVQPLDGTLYDFGYLTIGAEKTVSISVRGIDLSEAVTVSSSADWYSYTPKTISVADACSGTAKVVLTWVPTTPGDYNGTLTFTSSSCKATVRLAGRAMPGLTADTPLAVSDRSFVASWPYVGDEFDDGTYLLCWQRVGDTAVESVSVPASDEMYEVEGLLPDTRYIYWMQSVQFKSNEVEFTTSIPIPSLVVTIDAPAVIPAVCGKPTPSYEMTIDAENIDTDITVEVSYPFEISTDNTDWQTSLTIDPQTSLLYLRVNASETGTYTSTLRLRADNYVNDHTELVTIVSADRGFFEDFDADAADCDTYNGCTYRGIAATWYLDNAGIWESDASMALSRPQCLRMGKSSSSTATMLTDKTGGASAVVLYARKWSASEANCRVTIDYSVDGGVTWTESGTVADVGSTDYTRLVFALNVEGDVRIRVRQTAGARFIIDDLSIGDYGDPGYLDDASADSRCWDAYSRDGRLVVETTRPMTVRAFGVDGVTYLDAQVNGSVSLSVPMGLYVVWANETSRRVLVGK